MFNIYLPQTIVTIATIDMFILYLPQTIDNYSNYRYVYHTFAINHSDCSNYRYVCYIFFIHPNVIAVINRHSYGAPPSIGMIFRTEKSLNLGITGMYLLVFTYAGMYMDYMESPVHRCGMLFLRYNNLGCFKTVNPCCDL